jgi:hypothetical protein
MGSGSKNREQRFLDMLEEIDKSSAELQHVYEATVSGAPPTTRARRLLRVMKRDMDALAAEILPAYKRRAKMREG